MKKSEMYHLAQIAVLNTPIIAPESKLEILAELIDAEKLELFSEKQKAEKAVEE